MRGKGAAAKKERFGSKRETGATEGPERAPGSEVKGGGSERGMN